MNPPRTLVLRKLLCRRNFKRHHAFDNTFIMDIKMLIIVSKIENALGIYRNYCFFSRKKRIFSNIRIITELGFITIAFAIGSLSREHQETSYSISLLLTVINSFVVIVLARWHSGSFKGLISHIDDNHRGFLQDTIYLNRIEKKHKAMKLILLCQCINSIVLMCLRHDNITFANITHNANMLLCNIRYVFEYFVLYATLFVLSEQVKCIIRGVEKSVQAIVRETVDGVDNNAGRSVRVDLDRFDKWTIAYTNVKESSNLFNTIFGVQITVMLVAVMMYFIIFLYGVAYISILGSSQYPTLVFYFLKLLIYLLALFMLSRSAQALQNSVDSLRRQLAKLLIHCPITDVRHRATKDLLRLVSARAVRTRAFGSVTIDMTLIPSTVMFFTTYTVIALQLNNVV